MLQQAIINMFKTNEKNRKGNRYKEESTNIKAEKYNNQN